MTKNVLLTGATSGVGLALIPALQMAGFTPIVTSRDSHKVIAVTAKYGVPGYALDVADPAAILEVTKKAVDECGPVAALINNAGLWLEGDFDSHSSDTVQKVMNTNAMGTINMTHAVLPDMLARGAGTVINVLSTAALMTRKQLSVYAASKWAIRGFTGCLEYECAPKGVRVMGFYPGKIATNMYETAGVERDISVAMTAEKAAEMLLTMLSDDKMVWGQISGRSLADYV